MSSFSRNTALTFCSRLLQLVFGVITSVIIARVLGPEGRGIYSLVMVFQGLMVNVTDFGVGAASVYYMGKDRYRLREIFGVNMLLSALMGLVAIVIGVGIVVFGSQRLFPGISSKCLFLALGAIPLWFFSNWTIYIMAGLNRFGEFNGIKLIAPAVIMVFLSASLLIGRVSVPVVLTIQIVASFVTCVYIFCKTSRIIGRPQIPVTCPIYSELTSYGFRTYLGCILSFIHYRIDSFLIVFFLGPLQFGLYSVGVGLAEQIMMFADSASVALFQRVSMEKDNQRLRSFTPVVYRNIMLISVSIAAVLFMLGGWVISFLYSDKFLGSVVSFQILLLGTVAMSGRKIFAEDLYGRGRPMFNVYITACAVVLNIVLNILFIPRFGIEGAAWASTISYSVAFGLFFVLYCRISGNSLLGILKFESSDFLVYRRLLPFLAATGRAAEE